MEKNEFIVKNTILKEDNKLRTNQEFRVKEEREKYVDI